MERRGKRVNTGVASCRDNSDRLDETRQNCCAVSKPHEMQRESLGSMRMRKREDVVIHRDAQRNAILEDDVNCTSPCTAAMLWNAHANHSVTRHKNRRLKQTLQYDIEKKYKAELSCMW
ncbi:hypothetical protein BDR04DRAFT_241760 [Suillus decipiens]|nr:hypothetical protein BDR04DRAFT_241760 [Suillus decipiens]